MFRDVLMTPLTICFSESLHLKEELSCRVRYRLYYCGYLRAKRELEQILDVFILTEYLNISVGISNERDQDHEENFLAAVSEQFREFDVLFGRRASFSQFLLAPRNLI